MANPDKAHLETLEAENRELRAILSNARFAIEATNACLMSWNGTGSPVNTEGIMRRIDSVLHSRETVK